MCMALFVDVLGMLPHFLIIKNKIHNWTAHSIRKSLVTAVLSFFELWLGKLSVFPTEVET